MIDIDEVAFNLRFVIRICIALQPALGNTRVTPPASQNTQIILDSMLNPLIRGISRERYRIQKSFTKTAISWVRGEISLADNSWGSNTSQQNTNRRHPVAHPIPNPHITLPLTYLHSISGILEHISADGGTSFNWLWIRTQGIFFNLAR